MDLNEQNTRKIDSTHSNTDISIEKNPKVTITNTPTTQEPVDQGKRLASSTSNISHHDNTSTIKNPNDPTQSSTLSQKIQKILPQETNLKSNNIPSNKNYKIFHTNRLNCNRASGGIASLIHIDYPSEQISIHSHLEVIAVQITLESKISICNIYIPNQTSFDTSDIDNIIKQLPKAFN
ncbi:Hypothetical protein CINCED_3A011280 [Cinara cedri]|uniref:Uncharacterized protein n=1 Tax=Cinara cedri TaxID=506608 RepID=A0A5E4MYT3_9HEMI|nr:Hypothetical protein CINCED_3A011280 [Cinara cedri]